MLYQKEDNTIFNAVKCNLTKLTTKSAVSVLVSMVSDFWHTSMRMAIVGQRLLVFEHAQTTGTHCLEILLGLGAYYRKVRIFYSFIRFLCVFFSGSIECGSKSIFSVSVECFSCLVGTGFLRAIKGKYGSLINKQQHVCHDGGCR
jgi:hypothetical protein